MKWLWKELKPNKPQLQIIIIGLSLIRHKWELREHLVPGVLPIWKVLAVELMGRAWHTRDQEKFQHIRTTTVLIETIKLSKDLNQKAIVLNQVKVTSFSNTQGVELITLMELARLRLKQLSQNTVVMLHPWKGHMTKSKFQYYRHKSSSS